MTESDSPPTHAPATRRFNVGDTLILIAALCLGLSGIRDRIRTLPARAEWWLDQYRRFRVEATSVPPMSTEDYDFSVRSLEYYLSDEFQTWLSSGLIALTIAQVMVRLRPPRPAWRTLVRQPGFLGCCHAALIGYAIDKGWVPLIRFENLHFPFMTALAVLLAWSVLLVFRRCLAEGSWIDRLGRVAGVGWIGTALYSLMEQIYLW